MERNEEIRCECKKLLFKVTTRGVEFKCPRCKRYHLIKSGQLTGDYQEVDICSESRTLNHKTVNHVARDPESKARINKEEQQP